ncbi:MAG: hypothetical protein ACE5EF_12705 [Dehalococcoidia bacterium]
MAIDRFCHACGKRVRPKRTRQDVPGSNHTRHNLLCPLCGKELGAVYDDELRIDKTFPAPRG